MSTRLSDRMSELNMYVAGLHETISGSTGSAVVHNDANLPAISV